MKIFSQRALSQKILLLKGCLPVLLAVLGLTLVAVGVGMIYAPAGVITGGIGCFLLEHRVTEEKGGRK